LNTISIGKGPLRQESPGARVAVQQADPSPVFVETERFSACGSSDPRIWARMEKLRPIRADHCIVDSFYLSDSKGKSLGAVPSFFDSDGVPGRI
jgi:hypothetical protein